MAQEPEAHRRLGPYRLVERLGEGGMGVVHLAEDPHGQQVAIKVLRPHVAHDGDARRRLAREVDTLSRVRHPLVAAVLDADVDGDAPYIVTEYVPGPPLDEVVAHDGPLSPEQLVTLGRGLSDALGAIHEVGIVHRDLKPGNVLMVEGDPVVIDFGIAHVGDDSRLTRTGLVMGTPGYLSPEVVEGAPVTTATDWWGWAATLSFAASGEPPFGRGPVSVVLDRVTRGQADLRGVDPRLAPLLAASLSPVAQERPDADEVIEALELYARGRPVTEALPHTSHTTGHTAVLAPGRPAAGPPQGYPPQGYPPQGYPPQGYPGPGGPEPGWGVPPPYRSPDPRIGRPRRTGTLAAAVVAVVALAATWPLVGALVLVLWSVAARTADRAVTAQVLRRHAMGPRRSDTAVAVVAGPWHFVRSALVTLAAVLLPAFMAAAGTVAAAYGLGAMTTEPVEPQHALPVAAGALLGTVMIWWGPGGTSVRRGSRSILRGVLPSPVLTQAAVGVLLVLALVLALWSWQRGGGIDWWPSPDGELPLADWLPRLPR